MAEQLEDLSAELQIKKVLTSDQQSLYKKVSDFKSAEVSVIIYSGMYIRSYVCCYICIYYYQAKLNQQNKQVMLELKNTKEKHVSSVMK